jgi:membrane-bound inhibitor of C-type lysozyme
MQQEKIPVTLILAAALAIGCGSPDAAPESSAESSDSTVAATSDSALIAAEEVVPTLGADTLAGFYKFRCADGSGWGATYWNGPSSRVVLSSDEAAYTLPQQVSASGARYADEGGSIEWWAKGDSATLKRRGATIACAVDPTVAL